jgi:hypothetical protein
MLPFITEHLPGAPPLPGNRGLFIHNGEKSTRDGITAPVFACYVFCSAACEKCRTLGIPGSVANLIGAAQRQVIVSIAHGEYVMSNGSKYVFAEGQRIRQKHPTVADGDAEALIWVEDKERDDGTTPELLRVQLLSSIVGNRAGRRSRRRLNGGRT